MGLHKVFARKFHSNHPAKRASASSSSAAPNADSKCKTGGFVTSPSNGLSFSSSYPLNITWDTTCLNSTNIDIYLYAPAAATPLIHTWASVPFAKGSYNTTLNPAWWNGTSTAQLQLTLISSGDPIFSNPFPGGPVFTATYSGKPVNSTPGGSDSVTQVTGGISTDRHSLAPGKTAAAVLMPLLIVGVVIGAYMRMIRQKSKEKRKTWAEAVDKRMSTISTDWKSMSAAGAQAAIRSSIAVSNRNSTAFSFGNIRPQSAAGVEGYDESATREMSQVRPTRGLGLAGELGSRSSVSLGGSRVSRVSFAEPSRPSGETARSRVGGMGRKNVPSRAFHSGYVPPLPGRENEEHDSYSSEDDSREGSMSPTQTAGAMDLSAEDIRSRVAGRDVDEVLPALAMMRTTNTDTSDGDFVPLPSAPAPVHTNPSRSLTNNQSNYNPTSTNPMSPITPVYNPTSPPANTYNYATALPPTPTYTPPSYTSSPAVSQYGQYPQSNEYDFSAASTAPAPAPYSTLMVGAPMMNNAMQTNALSPDAMLRAYATRPLTPGGSGASAKSAAPVTKQTIGAPIHAMHTSPSPSTYSYAGSSNRNSNGSGSTNAAGVGAPMRRAPSLNKRAGANRAVSVVGEEMEKYRLTVASADGSDVYSVEEEGEWSAE